MTVQNRGAIVSFESKYFKIYSAADNSFLGIAGADGHDVCYKTRHPALCEIIGAVLKDMSNGLYVEVDDTNFFILTSLKKYLGMLRADGSIKFLTSETLSRAGSLDLILEEEYGKENVG